MIIDKDVIKCLQRDAVMLAYPGFIELSKMAVGLG